jgi:hypothetical protein
VQITVLVASLVTGHWFNTRISVSDRLHDVFCFHVVKEKKLTGKILVLANHLIPIDSRMV